MAKSRSDDEDFEESPAARGADEHQDNPQRSKSKRRRDDDDEEDRPRRKKSRGGALSGIIPYRNGMALTAYYCGFAGLITILGSIALLKAQIPQPNSRMVFVLLFAGGGFLAFLANLFGILGLRSVTINPDAKGTGHAVTGLIMGVLEIIGLLALLLFSLEAGVPWLSLR
jgi:hypothetical protein